MNSKTSRIVLRERTFSDVADLSLRFLVTHGTDFAALCASVLLPCALITFVISALDGGAGLSWLFAWTVLPFAQIPFTLLVSRLVFSEHVSRKEILKSSLRAIIPVLWVRILRTMAIFAGSFGAFIPSVWIGASTLFVTETIALEQLDFGDAWKRSSRLYAAGSGEVLLLTLCLAAAYPLSVLVGDVVGSAVLQSLDIKAPPPIWQTGKSMFGLVALFAFLPLATVTRFFFYVSVRTSTEGWDIQTRFFAIAARESEALAQRES